MKTKYEHRNEMVKIGIQAIEHALRFLPQDNQSRKVIEKRLTALRSGDIKSIGRIEPETTYSQESCLRRASAELLKLSVSEKWLSGSMLTSGVFVSCWDAGSFIGRGEEMKIEQEWQNTNLYPQIEKRFE